MTITYADGTTDSRPTIAITYPGCVAHAIQIDEDFTHHSVIVDQYKDNVFIDTDFVKTYKTIRLAQYLGVDGNRSIRTAYEFIGLGDELMVFKGRKYAKGTTFYVKGKFVYDGRVEYVIGWNPITCEEIKVSLDNCIYIGHDDEIEECFKDSGCEIRQSERWGQY